MARLKDREKALSLRKQGMSYGQIKKILKISKSTLSLWLRGHPLSKQKIRELRDWNEQKIEKYRETMRQKRETRLDQFYKEQKSLLFPFSKRELFLTGLFLYWGEGSKSHLTDISLSNNNSSIIRFFINWLVKSLLVPESNLKIQLHLYNDMDINKELGFWSRILNIPLAQFYNPYIKKTSSVRINHKGGFGHGTCNVRIGDVRLTEKIQMAIRAITNKYDKCARSSTAEQGPYKTKVAGSIPAVRTRGRLAQW